jgi:hypothetical protein
MLDTTPEPDKHQEWLLLEQIILSGQMDETDLHARLQEAPAFAEWLRQRARQRQT